MNIWVNVLQAFGSIRANLLRACLTMLIISFGIMAIVGVMTSIDGIKFWLSKSFSSLGANTFKILDRESSLKIGSGRQRTKRFVPISYSDAKKFKDKSEGVIVSFKTTANLAGKAQYKSLTTNNNINVSGIDENFLITDSYTLAEGRPITIEDVEAGRSVAMIGNELKVLLFPKESPIGKTFFVDRKQYTIIGLFTEKGTTFGSYGDRLVAVPITTLMQDFPSKDRSINISVYVDDPNTIIENVNQSIGILRLVRRLNSSDMNNFAILISDSFINSLMENLRILTWSATAIAIITLFGASIGLMNIMLVSVTERTREIGVRKALGATQSQIKLQFLIEAITICQMGGLLGVIFGVGIGNIVSFLLGADLFIPWEWVLSGIGICFIVGTISGFYPAMKAAKLDPIESLRYE